MFIHVSNYRRQFRRQRIVHMCSNSNTLHSLNQINFFVLITITLCSGKKIQEMPSPSSSRKRCWKKKHHRSANAKWWWLSLKTNSNKSIWFVCECRCLDYLCYANCAYFESLSLSRSIIRAHSDDEYYNKTKLCDWLALSIRIHC